MTNAIQHLTSKQFVRAMKRLANVTGRFVTVLETNSGYRAFMTFADFDDAYDAIATLPVARDCNFKFVQLPNSNGRGVV